MANKTPKTSSVFTVSRLANKTFSNLLKLVSSNLFLRLTFVWFTLQALFFAITVRFGLPPDEHYHYELISFFSDNNFSPFLNSQSSVPVLKEVIHTPFILYHYLLSIPYVLIRNLPGELIILRLFSVALGIGSLFLVVKIANQVGLSKLVRNISIFMLANTLMFVLVFASVSYDSLFIFLSLLAILLLLKIRQKPSAYLLLLLTTTILSGLMVKKNFIPVAFIVCLLLVVSYYKKLPDLFRSFKKTFPNKELINIILCILIVLLGLVFTERYGLNFIKYGSYDPGCAKVRSLVDCQQSPLFARNEYIYRVGHPTPDRNLGEYVVNWVVIMEERTFGLFAHERFKPNKVIDVWAKLTSLVGFVLIARYWGKRDRLLSVLLVICLFNIAVLFVQNYSTYLNSGLISFAVHGRYLFGVLPIIYLLVSHFFLKALSGTFVRGIFVALTIAVFVTASLPSYIIYSESSWNSLPAQIPANID
jgi:hypothetical protein